MSDKMSCMPFDRLLQWIRTEHDTKGTIFGVHRPYKADGKRELSIFGRRLETPVGPAAGPNSQLAQNIVAAYYAGCRFFELKTVQIMDGAELAACVNKPCIKADDECYNCEWSTELYVPEAQDEYIKAWFLLAFIAKEYGLGEMDGFQFNISVGYDLKGIQSPKIDLFIESMKNAVQTETFQNCRQYLIEHIEEFNTIKKEDIEQISPFISNSVTLSTLHGCPPEEIERIADYLLSEKKMHTFIKCNPTLLGYEFARETLDRMGYDYIAFGRFHFEDDLQYGDAVPMLERLMKLSEEQGLEFGVKITNTFPVDVKAGELPSEEMYMSGKSLYPLSIALAAKLSHAFGGKLRIAYSGGADAFNMNAIVAAGVWPVTVATTILKPGGYQRVLQLVENLQQIRLKPFEQVDADALEQLAKDALTDSHYTKPAKMPSSRKSKERVPLLDCYTAPCQDTCPIHQDIPAYIELAGEGKYEEALQVILKRNALPFITGTICAHGCMSSCTRNFYETPVQIRDTKLLCAQKAYDAVIKKWGVQGAGGKKTAVVGGGPSGMAAAFYLARAGASVVLYEKRAVLGGIVSSVIPDFRIDDSVIAKDAVFLERLGVDIRCNTEAPSVDSLKKEGFEAVVLAVGAYKRSELELEGQETINALAFLEQYNVNNEKLNIGKNIVVIGGGNTAMDTARAAIRCKGVEHVYLVYRRTKRYMPADEHELQLALQDGVEFKELLAPVKIQNGELVCHKTILGEMDASGRAGVMETQEVVAIPADTVIAAVGEKVPTDYYMQQGICVDDSGRAKVSEMLETNVSDVYVIGDGLYGPSVVVKGMAQAMKAAEAITGTAIPDDRLSLGCEQDIYRKKGVLIEAGGQLEAERCLSCSLICENCADVCPNRANVSIRVPELEKTQIIHVDYMCNECGNCKSFCPYESAPYLDKFTLFASESDMMESKNDGFLMTDRQSLTGNVRYLGELYDVGRGDYKCVPGELQKVIKAVCNDYTYILP